MCVGVCVFRTRRGRKIIKHSSSSGATPNLRSMRSDPFKDKKHKETKTQKKTKRRRRRRRN